VICGSVCAREEFNVISSGQILEM